MRFRPSIVLLLIALAGCGAASSGGSPGDMGGSREDVGGSREDVGGSCVDYAEVQALQQEIDTKNRKDYESAVARAKGTPGYGQITPTVRRDEFVPELSPFNPTPDRPPPKLLAKGPERGLLQGEAIVATAATDKTPSKIMFGTTVCSDGSSCGCVLRPEYHFASAPGGRVAIIRLNPQLQYDKVFQCGSCGTGCGIPPRPESPTTYELPVDDVSKVDVIDIPYEWHHLNVDCERMTPAP